MTTYELYHDESMENGYWHGMLLVPIEKKDKMLEALDKARNCTGYYEPISLKSVHKKNRIFSCANAWVHIGCGFLRSRSKNQSYPIRLGYENGKPITLSLENDEIGAKFILFRERDNHQKMKGYPDSPSKIETTIRFALKGGLHYLGSDENSIHIEKMHFDGHKHYLRSLDKKRIVGRISCPKCGSVYSSYVSECPTCKNSNINITVKHSPYIFCPACGGNLYDCGHTSVVT